MFEDFSQIGLGRGLSRFCGGNIQHLRYSLMNAPRSSASIFNLTDKVTCVGRFEKTFWETGTR